MKIAIPQLSLVVLIGASGSGKSTFARQHFGSSEILSSDVFRGLVSDDENDQAATGDAFEVLHFLAAKRLARGKLVVVDATNVQPESRKPLIELARRYHVLPVAIVLNLPERVCQDRNVARPDRTFGPHVIRQQRSTLRSSLRGLQREGFRHVFVLDKVEQVEQAVIELVPLWNDLRHEHGPFDIIGDLHGCCDELEELLDRLGYMLQRQCTEDTVWGDNVFSHPQGRKAVFVGDLVDRGPRNLDTLRTVRNMVHHGHAICVPGNHDMKLLRKLRGNAVQVKHGLEITLSEFEALPDDARHMFQREVIAFLDGLVSHYVLDDGNLVVAHAGMKEEMQGRGSSRVRDFALYGETTGESDEFGLPVRLNWAAEYRGRALVVYGHTPVPEPDALNRTMNIDTGCVFGGKLTALRYPEQVLVSVPSRRTYCEPSRPFLPATPTSPGLSAQHEHDDLLDATDVLGKRIITTCLERTVTIREENAAAALEIMSRFAVNPKWLIYLPPTMSPAESSQEHGLLEHPAEALDYFKSQGVTQVVCEEKHMGSRVVVVVCRDHHAARERFGICEEGAAGIAYTRTGRPFFNNSELETAFLERLRQALSKAQFWEEFHTNWVCLDCELMPWSAKAQELIRSQYAAVGAAGSASLPSALMALRQTAERTAPSENNLAELIARFTERQESIARFVKAYQQYCWHTAELKDLKLAPFHLLATEGKVHTDHDHLWHMETLSRLCREDTELLLPTKFRVIDLSHPDSVEGAIHWWFELTERGGEGMVVKPRDWLQEGVKGRVQPAIKCRGKNYLRIIYGPDYDAPENLSRLRNRSLARKRSLAQREFALGVEALQRFVSKEPLRRVHECVFGLLALESEPVDPRL